MNLLKYGFNFVGGYLYDTKPKTKPKRKRQTIIDVKKYEPMLNEFKMPIDVVVDRLDELFGEPETTSTAPEKGVSAEAPEIPPEIPPEAQIILDNMERIQREWLQVQHRFHNPHVHRYMSPKTYIRHIGHFRQQINTMLKGLAYEPLTTEEMMATYQTGGDLLTQMNQQRNIWKYT